MENIKECIDDLYKEINVKNREISDLKCRIDILERDMYEICSHTWVVEPRNYGCDHLEYRCSLCFLYKN